VKGKGSQHKSGLVLLTEKNESTRWSRNEVVGSKGEKTLQEMLKKRHCRRGGEGGVEKKERKQVTVAAQKEHTKRPEQE